MSAQAEHRYERFFDARLFPAQNKAVEMARNGFSCAEIAEELDTSENCVRTLLSRARKLGVTVPLFARQPQRDAHGWTAKDLMRLRDAGLTVMQIAERTGNDVENVCVRLSQLRRRLGLPMQRQVSRKESAVRWLAEYRAGKALRQIARDEGLAWNIVYGAVSRLRRKLAKQEGASR